MNAILVTALKKRKGDIEGKLSDLQSLKCDVCSYECERYVTLQKHKNTNHRLIKCGINQNADRSSVGDNDTLERSLHPILLCGHKDRQPSLVATAASGPREKFYQLGVRFKRSHKITPVLVPESPPSMHSPTPLLSPLPSSPPAIPALRSTITHQILAETIGNHKASRKTGRHHKVRLTKHGGQTKGDLPSVD